VNSIDLLWNQIGQGPRGPAQVSASTLSSCKQRNLSITRFAATPYWPVDLKSTYLANRTLYWLNMQTLVATAKANNCQLVASLFFNWFCFVDVAGEPLGQSMRNASSASRALWLTYITEMVTLFKSEPAIVAWELGNELNLLVDLNLTEQQPSIAPGMGTPARRTQLDNFSTTDMISFVAWMGHAIQSLDTELRRPIGSGFATPRPSAWHLEQSYHSPERDWTADTQAQFEGILEAIHPDPISVVTVHYYPGDGKRFGVQNPNSTAALEIAGKKAKSLGKTFYVGEFGNENPGPRLFSHAVLVSMAAMASSGVDVFGTIWIWEFYQFSATQVAPYSLLPGRDDEMITAMEKYNDGAKGFSAS
jgi:hypothetical protein